MFFSTHGFQRMNMAEWGAMFSVENWRHAGFLYIGIRKRKTTVKWTFGVEPFLPVQRNSCFQFKKRARRRTSRQGMVVEKGVAGLVMEKRKSGEKEDILNELFAAHFLMTFYCAALVQASATPIAEFQSQLPIWLSMDKLWAWHM